MKRNPRLYLQDMLEAMTAAERFVKGKEKKDLEEDLQLPWALERAFMISGEAAERVDPDLRARHSDVPWQDMIGMRNVLVHGYWAVKLDVVWTTLQQRFPREKPKLQRILNQLPKDER